MVTLHWTPQAIDDLEAIFKYINRDSHQIAKLFIEKIYHQVDQLRHFPLSGRSVPEIEREDIRELLFKNYRIVYQIKSDRNVRILTIFRSNKNLDETKLP